MKTAGQPGPWKQLFPKRLIPQILDLIIAAWKSFTKPIADETEPNVTRRFLHVLKANRDMRDLPLNIFREGPDDDPSTAEEIGRIDLKFYCDGQREHIYFAVECKKLNVTYASGFNHLAQEYVKKGMVRFFNGQYSTNLDSGAMLGYVLDGQIQGAINEVESKIATSAAALQIDAPGTFKACTFFPSKKSLKETSHRNGRFRLYHIFVNAA